MCFPDNCLKGIPNATFVIEGRTVAAHLFYFNSEHSERSDGWREQSVNWEDDEYAVEFTLNQGKEDDGEKQFGAGVAVLSRHEIDRANRAPMMSGKLSYERDALEHNLYHGNILLRRDVVKAEMRMIAATLAAYVSRIVPQH